MTIKVGDKLPEATFMIMGADGPAPLTSDELFTGKKVAIFSLPGAFTPTCSARHLPGFVEKADEIKSKGVDTIVCTAVNDVFVMDAWGKDQGVGDKVVMAADGNGTWVREIGLVMDGTGFGMGRRGQRFSMLVNDGVVETLNVEEPGGYDVSSAEYILGQL